MSKKICYKDLSTSLKIAVTMGLFQFGVLVFYASLMLLGFFLIMIE